MTIARHPHGVAGIRRRKLLALPAAVVAAALIGPPGLAAAATPAAGSFAPTSAQAVSGATSQGIIMRDGGICDPIRHIGC
jgi:hypothetical protein